MHSFYIDDDAKGKNLDANGCFYSYQN